MQCVALHHTVDNTAPSTAYDMQGINSWHYFIFSLCYFTQYDMIKKMTLHCITLNCITLHYITLHYDTFHYSTLCYITLHYITIYYISVHFITLHYATLYTVLHYIAIYYLNTKHIYYLNTLAQTSILPYITLHCIALY